MRRKRLWKLKRQRIHSSPYSPRSWSVTPRFARWLGPAYHFPVDLPERTAASVLVTAENIEILQTHLGGWSDDVLQGRLLYAAVANGEAVSVCASARETRVAHEAGVETALPFRGQGYAVPAVTAWAAAVRERNQIPLYSSSWANGASLALARKIGLIQFASDLHLG
jgi:hypothetical protein